MIGMVVGPGIRNVWEYFPLVVKDLAWYTSQNREDLYNLAQKVVSIS